MDIARVVPLAGTWIEIISPKEGKRYLIVVPLAGTWIEISILNTRPTQLRVVPLAGTWIEIANILAIVL